MLKKIVTGLIGFAGTMLVFAGDPVDVELVTVSEGLSNNRVNALYQDSIGFLWLGTNDGLNRYDGYHFVVYRQEAFNSSSISSNTVTCIENGPNGCLWIGTNAGLSYFNRTDGSFTNYFVPDKALITSIRSGPDGSLLVLTEDHLFRLDPASGTFTQILTDGLVQRSLMFRSGHLFTDDAGHCWLGTRNGLYVLRARDSILQATTLRGMAVNDFRIDETGQFWLATSRGLVLFNRSLMEWNLYIAPYHDFEVVEGISEPGDGLFQLICSNGLIQFNPLTHQFGSPGALSLYGRVFDLPAVNGQIVDRSQILWIATDEGLVRHDFKPKSFNWYSTNETSIPRLLTNNIFALYKDADERIWMGTRNDGLMIMDRSAGTVNQYYPGGKGKFKLPLNRVVEIFSDRQNRVWVCDTQVYFFDKEKEAFVNMADYYGLSKEQVPDFSRIYDILEVRPGYYLMGTRKGLWHIDENNKHFKLDTLLKTDSTVVDLNEIASLERDREGNIWIASSCGAVRMDPDLQTWKSYTRGEETGITGNLTYSILCDRKGTIWLGTSGGLAKYIPETDKFKPYTVKDGLPNDFIYALLEDQHGHIWISTNQGLSVLDPETDIPINYELKDGLQSMEYNLHSAYRAADNEILFGGIGGLNSFYPDSLSHKVNPPQTVITGMKFLGKSQDASRWVPGQKEIRITDKQTIQIMFSALDYTSSRHNNYRYQLATGGESPDFISLGRENSVILSELKYGVYHFRVNGSNSDGIWSKEPAEVDIIVSAPFYRHRLFRSILIALFVILVYLVYRFQTRTLRQSNRILREKEIAAQEVLRQRNLLSRRNKNIEDSLMYAQRIQLAMFSTARDIKRLFPDSFVFQRPKDIVSGDFFWTREIDHKIFVAAADCTGHGVPGAFMSLIGLELFRQIITGKGLYKPADILDELNRNFNIIFGNMEDISLKDGMDLSFCTFHTDTNIMEFAGAFNPVYLIRDSEIIEIKGDRITVGPDNGFPRPPFTNQTVQLQPNDIIYMFSDGYADQFGGPEGKKFKFRRFRHLLLSIHHHGMDKQRKILEDSIMDWIGDYEQVDDMMVLGLKPYKKPD